jgi:hypothetical protein
VASKSRFLSAKGKRPPVAIRQTLEPNERNLTMFNNEALVEAVNAMREAVEELKKDRMEDAVNKAADAKVTAILNKLKDEIAYRREFNDLKFKIECWLNRERAAFHGDDAWPVPATEEEKRLKRAIDIHREKDSSLTWKAMASFGGDKGSLDSTAWIFANKILDARADHWVDESLARNVSSVYAMGV